MALSSSKKKDEIIQTIELDEEEEGNQIELEDLFFKRVGGPIPLKPQPSNYDLQNPPTQPLAVSQNPQALFLAHSQGFYVARTTDVLDKAKETEKGSSCSIEELSVADVQIGRVCILAVSTDSSTLAACVDAQIHFFSTTSLLNREQKPFSSSSIDESSCVKDFHWRKKSKLSYIVLAKNGVLYQGDVDGPLKQVKDDVDAADWSPGGNSIAVAKKNNISIFSSTFKERLMISLSFNGWVGDSDSGSTKVDSIKWIRQDCMILGCIQIEDGTEVGYSVQIINSRDGKISEASSKPVVLSFSEAFTGIIDDIVPFGYGPYLFLDYLKHRELALVANRKNTDQHIILFGWSSDDGLKEVGLVELVQEDRWLPRIGLQDNEDDNLIMGFGIDNMSLCEKFEVTVGVETKELSTYCILLSLTLDAKLLMFYVAGSAENSDPPQSSSGLIYEEDDSSAVVPLSHDSSLGSSRLVEQEEGIVLDAKSQETDKNTLGSEEVVQVPKQRDEPSFVVKPPFNVSNISNRDVNRIVLDAKSQETDKNTLGSEEVVQVPKQRDEPSFVVKPPFNVSNISNRDVNRIVLDAKSQETDKNTLGSEEVVQVPKQRDEPSFVVKPPFNVSNISNRDVNRIVLDAKSQETDKNTLGSEEVDKDVNNSFGASSEPVSKSESQSSTVNKELKALGQFASSLKEGGQRNANLVPNALHQRSNPHVQYVDSPFAHGFDSVSRDARNSETQKSLSAQPGIGTGSLTRSISDSFQLNYENQLQTGQASKLFSGSIGRIGSLGASSESQGNLNCLSSDGLNTRLSFPKVDKSPPFRMDHAVNVPGSLSSPSHQYNNAFSFKDPSKGTQSFTHSAGRSTHFGGHIPSTRVGVSEPVPSVRSSQVESHGGATFEKSHKFKLQPMQENLKTQQSMRSEPELSKNFGNVHEMVKELDTLLSYIEGEGGFRDACTITHKHSVLALEQGLENLSERRRLWKNTMEERLEEIQHLLDKTVQVLARTTYMEGIVKQASDNQYWDIWNRQRLSPELEMRRRYILKVNQDLTNQLIELERHFNTLEINRFGEDGGAFPSQRMFRTGVETSKHDQSFHRLYNTMNSQLAAAEQLSECLSKQMSVLNIESPSMKRQSVTKELFESIGLDYDGDFFNSPNVKKAIHTPESVKKLPFPSSIVSAKGQSRRTPSSAMKAFEPESSRRRRDSLGLSRATFEPPKTTVKRMLLQEDYPSVSLNKSALATNRGLGSQLQQGLAVASLKDRTIPVHLINSRLKNDESSKSQVQVRQDIEDKSLKQTTPTLSFKWTTEHSRPSQFIESKSPTAQVTETNTLLSFAQSASYPGQILNTNDSSDSFSNKSMVSVTHSGKSDYPEVQPGLFSKSGLIPQIKTPSSSAKQGAVIDGSISAQSLKNHNSPFALSPASAPAVNLHEKTFQLETFTSKNQVGTPASTVPPITAVLSSARSPSPPIHSTPLSALPSSLPPSSSSVSFKDDSEDSSKPSIHAGPVVPSASSSSSSMPSFTSFKPFKLQLPDEHAPSSISSTSINSSTQALPAESKAHVGEFDLKANVSAALHTPASQPPDGEFGLKTNAKATSQAPASQPPDGNFDLKTDVNAISQASASQTPDGVGSPTASKVSAHSASATQPSLLTSNFSNISTAKLNSHPDLQSAERVQSSAVTSASSVATDRKNESLDLEDEMEEEAPEGTLNLNLGSLDSFGLGSSSTSAAPKSNPFGRSFQNAASTPGNSPFNLTVPSGELFRPATFSFQSGQPSQSPQPTNSVAFPGDFNTGSAAPEPTRSAFGQPAHIGAGQQALGSVLGSFGQSRQIGSGLQGSGFGSASGSPATGNHAGGFGFGTGLGTPSTGGFANAATGGGFAGVGTTGGGFAGVASGGGGFAAAASGGGGFAGAASGTGGFSGAAGSGGGFGAFSNNQGGGAFAAFGNSSAGSGKPSQLFTQMRR